MARKEKGKTIELPLELAVQIDSLNMPGSRNDRAVWFVREGIAAHPEIKCKDTEQSNSSQTIK
jgi:hypothetical protein